ncbi:protein HOTHEAD [Tanacetum coccineum]|uniref:Protein HOTHEAD n=1 Tax=Tanacetum coccineum TaxID=301880 RepID=A0ABQ4X3N1_9ASTR
MSKYSMLKERELQLKDQTHKESDGIETELERRKTDGHKLHFLGLLLGGIGPKTDLEKVTVPVVHDNQLVRKSLQGNFINAIYVPSKNSVKHNHRLNGIASSEVGVKRKHASIGLKLQYAHQYLSERDSITCARIIFKLGEMKGSQSAGRDGT